MPYKPVETDVISNTVIVKLLSYLMGGVNCLMAMCYVCYEARHSYELLVADEVDLRYPVSLPQSAGNAYLYTFLGLMVAAI